MIKWYMIRLKGRDLQRFKEIIDIWHQNVYSTLQLCKDNNAIGFYGVQRVNELIFKNTKDIPHNWKKGYYKEGYEPRLNHPKRKEWEELYYNKSLCVIDLIKIFFDTRLDFWNCIAGIHKINNEYYISVPTVIYKDKLDKYCLTLRYFKKKFKYSDILKSKIVTNREYKTNYYWGDISSNILSHTWTINEFKNKIYEK